MLLYACLVVILLFFAVQAIREKRLIMSAVWLAGVSAVLSVLLYLLDAYRVAVIELSVGAGLVTVLFVFAINISGEEAIAARSLLPRPVSWGLVIGSVVLLGWLILHLELKTAEPQADDAQFTATLWDQRGLDVLVQIVLIFAGTLGLLGLLAEAKAPLDYPVAKAVAAERDRELQTMQDTAQSNEEGAEGENA